MLSIIPKISFLTLNISVPGNRRILLWIATLREARSINVDLVLIYSDIFSNLIVSTSLFHSGLLIMFSYGF